MNFLGAGIPIGEYWGITVRLHFTFLIYAYFLASSFGSFGFGLLIVLGLWFCILLHEFGHALAARWCDGEADEILLWPLGGLAYCRPAFHPTAHLITTVAGPFVTLVLWLLFWTILAVIVSNDALYALVPRRLASFIAAMCRLNLWLLLFNMLPAFPMDGGRILRDTLWHFMSAETATKIAIRVSQVIGITCLSLGAYSLATGMPGVNFGAFSLGPTGLIIVALFILMQSAHEKQIVGFEARGTYQFSIRDRLRRGSRRRAFQQAVSERAAEEASQPFHRCAACGRTDDDSPTLEFRVCDECSNGEEYCAEHLHDHKHARG